MSANEIKGETSAAGGHEVAPSRMRRYLLRFCAVWLVLYLSPFALLRFPGFEAWGGSYHGPMLDYAYTLKGEDADVVIFGDSAALYDVDTVAMSKELGLKVINLPSTIGSLPIMKDAPLKSYLSKNKRPLLIIFYFGPWGMNYSDLELPYEGEEMLARHGSWRQILDFSRAEPGEVLRFPFEFYAANPKAVFMGAVRHQDRGAMIRAEQGHHPADAGPPQLPDPCTFPPEYTKVIPHEVPAALLKKYQDAGQRTLFYVAAVPDCVNERGVTGKDYSDIPAAAPKALPQGIFVDYIHMNAQGVPVATHSLAEAARPLLAAAGAATAR